MIAAKHSLTRRKPPLTLLASGVALAAALVLFVLGRFELGIGALVLHWLLGAIVLARRRQSNDLPPPSHGSTR